ncbi:MAG TPA: transglutaminase-like domain-containing protein [Chthonomonadaceae bacterium]|nr:transglutaminase-like domain-containing protein [Chthonomonadaceae bacterium]
MCCYAWPLRLLLFALFYSFGTSPALCQAGRRRAEVSASGKRFEGPFHLVATPVRQVQVIVTETMQSPALDALQWGIVAAQAPSYAGQTILESQFSIPGVRAARVQSCTDRSPLRQGYWLATYPVTREEQRARATAQSVYRALLYARVLTPGADTVAVKPLTGDERFLYLTASNVTNYATLGFRRWLRQADLLRRTQERDLDFAYRALEYIAQNFRYHWVQGSSTDPADVVNRGESHCTGIANLYIATLRASGIPARLAVGRRIVNSSSPQAMVTNGALTIDPGTAHVAAEFYAEGVGWVPVEPTCALGAADVTPFFGRSDGSLLVMHFDSMWLDTRTRNLQGMEWDYGRWRGSWNGRHLSDTMQVQPTAVSSTTP